ncbi:hypothetical protein [Mycobacterium sp. 1274756.6]|uniref:hypothetical protein n=1 Tax=Mycobacterium sp. 1274756.6 TaxID=1834076 RepID=UPI000A96840E|nr:hypothetical protein [Mycobacterium sp. 1274756.6]
MCQPVRCRQCGKTTWAGCGRHIEAVRATVPADQWCGGHQRTRPEPLFARLRRRLRGR